MEEITAAILAALGPITASVADVTETEIGDGKTYGVELPNGDQFFVTIEPA